MSIQELRVGDLVYALNEETDSFELRAVTGISNHFVTHVINIQINGYEGNNFIIADACHSFYESSEKRWCAAQDLKSSMVLQSCYDKVVVVTEVQQIALEAIVYELTIEEHHNFCMTSDGIVAHNAVFVIPIIVWGPGGAALAGGILKAACAGIGTAILYKVVSRITGASLDNGIDISSPNFFGPIDPRYNVPGIIKPQCVLPSYEYWGDRACMQPLIQNVNEFQGGCISQPNEISCGSLCPVIEQNEHSEKEIWVQPSVEDLIGWPADKGFVNKKGQEPKAPDPNGAQAPGTPGPKNNFKPPKNWNGEKVRSPKGYGWPDKYGNIWVPTGPSGHRGAHWDVQNPKGKYQNVLPDDELTGNWK